MENAPTNYSKGVNNLLSHFNKLNIPYVIRDNNILTIDLNCVDNFSIQYVDELRPYGREELIEIRVKLERLGYQKGLSDTWSRAYINAADSIDRLDAMIARTEIQSSDIKFSNDENV